MQQLDHILSGLTEDPRGGALHDVVVLAPGYTHGDCDGQSNCQPRNLNEATTGGDQHPETLLNPKPRTLFQP